MIGNQGTALSSYGVEWDSSAVEPGGTSEIGAPAGAMRIRVLEAEDVVLGTQDVKLGAGQRLELRVTTLGG